MARSFNEGQDVGKGGGEGGGGDYSHPEGAAALPPQDAEPQLPPPEHIVQEGRHLYLDFIRTEISRNGLSDSCMTRTENNNIINAQQVLQWIRAGRELRQLADAFSRSKERDAVRMKAAKVPVDSLDIPHFVHLLEELFQGGSITRERIVVLFYFCADVSIQALRLGLHRTFHILVDVSLNYIATHVAAWVHQCGGWGVVLRSSLDVVYQLSACCAFMAVVAACVVYIRRNL